MRQNNHKVFGIGFQKTATTSLGDALGILGYSVKGPFGWNNPNIKNEALDKAKKHLRKHDAFQDFPWSILYEEIDEISENSKFILTVRDKEEWFKSMVNHFGLRSTPMREWVYGAPYPRFNKETYIKKYVEHNRQVKRYFSGRENDLLVMDITKGDEWKKICDFLGHDIPKEKFPISNDKKERKINRIGRYVNSPISSIYKLIDMYKKSIKHYFNSRVK